MPSLDDVWSPNYHLNHISTVDSTTDNDLIIKIGIIKEFIDAGKLSRQANFEKYGSQLFSYLIKTETEMTGKSKLTPAEFKKKLENFQYETKGEKDESDEEMIPAEVDKFTEPQTRKNRADWNNMRQPLVFPITDKCGDGTSSEETVKKT